MTDFPPNRTAALTRLSAFAPSAGRDYAAGRNYDNHAHVSVLSPYLRHRIITETEVLSEVLRHHTPAAADKFIAEVCWRIYWKGWLERHPEIWARYKADLAAAHNAVQTQTGLRADWEAVCLGQTGIDCFDHWARELTTIGYLHNHARMWFASIWIHTLRLPWVLGADFFLRHLLDGDAASNTMSWRWVAGIQTMGKTYLARPDNIAKYTEGRFQPTGLATTPLTIDTPPHPPLGPMPMSDRIDPDGRCVHLITDDDMTAQHSAVASATYANPTGRSQWIVSPRVTAFTRNALAPLGSPLADVAEIADWAKSHDATQVVMNYTPQGPTNDGLHGLTEALHAQGITLRRHIRQIDQTGWPAATAGFFKFKAIIPDLLRIVADCRSPQFDLA